MDGGWLVSGGRVLASVEIAATSAERRRGLLGRDGIEGALVIDPCRWVHTVGMRFPIDVAYVASDGTVLKITGMGRWQLGMPVSRATHVIEAQRGAFERWGVDVGDRLELRDGA